MTARPRKTFKRQRVDRLADLRVADEVIHRDAYVFEKLKAAYRRNARPGRAASALGKHPSLYWRLRGNAFPLRQPNGERLLRWRQLSAWMKVQMASLVMAEDGYMVFTVHLHDELRMELELRGSCQKDYLRNRLTRLSKDRFGEKRHFFFVMEDMDEDGQEVRPHAHGSIVVRPAPLPARGEERHLYYKRMAARRGKAHAERVHGLDQMKEMLRAASGNVRDKCAKMVAGVDQTRNVWTSTPRRPFTNEQWVTYAFKNSQKVSRTLGDRNLALSQALRTEARMVWELVRRGEDAISQWD